MTTTMIRASDAERETTVQVLGRAHAEGRITMDELNERLERGVAARTRAELDALTADLPISGRRDAPRGHPFDPAMAALLGLALVLVAVVATAATRRAFFPWPLVWIGAAVAMRARWMRRGESWRPRWAR